MNRIPILPALLLWLGFLSDCSPVVSSTLPSETVIYPVPTVSLTSLPSSSVKDIPPSPSPTVQIPTATVLPPTASATLPSPSPNDFRLPAITAGNAHTCLINAAGGVKCWGDIQFGQLGKGDSPLSYLEYAPVAEGFELTSWAVTEVRGLNSGAKAVAAGAYHTCAITGTGGVECWGRNESGQLGDGTNTGSSNPVDVTGLSTGTTALAAGADHTCARLSTGGVQCWGANSSGQLGDETTTGSNIPVEVQGLPADIQQIVAGVDFTCALNRNGSIYCWGNGLNIGRNAGETSAVIKPVLVELKDKVETLAAGQYHLCALEESGATACWGGLTSDQPHTPQKPFFVEALDGEVVKLVAGGGNSCALTVEGGAWCWGDNYFGQLGNNSDLPSTTLVQAMGLNRGVVDLASGSGHVCALMEEGGITCWGDASAGQLGDRSIRWK